MIAGLGGLGSISAYYLAAAGVGRLMIVDRDRVAVENLNRQILHNTVDIGRPKVDSALEKLQRLNAGCRIEPVFETIDSLNARRLAEGCDLIIDATDNLKTRHVLNRASLEKQIPFIFGGIDGWNGMAATFIPGQTGCLACLFPEHRKTGQRGPAPALGPTAGVIATLQSLEAILILLGLPPRMANRMMDFRGLDLRFRTIRTEKNPDCSLCHTPKGVTAH
jgi:adenylyltransferase/sulfurtransferase